MLKFLTNNLLDNKDNKINQKLLLFFERMNLLIKYIYKENK